MDTTRTEALVRAPWPTLISTLLNVNVNSVPKMRKYRTAVNTVVEVEISEIQ